MSQYENETGLGLEVLSERPSPEDLHRRFIPGKLIPPGQPSSEDESLELTITNDYTMLLGEHGIVLGEQEIFLFNALLLLRDRPRTADELRSLGFITQSSGKAAIQKAFRGAYEFLAEQLNANGNKPLVMVEGNSWETALYFLSPNLTVTDKRTHEARVAPTPPIQPKRETASFVLQHGLRTERKQSRNVGDLYARLIDLDRIPNTPLREGLSPVEVAIVDNTTVRIGDQDVKLGPHERYLFNALMLLRDRQNAARDLRVFGYHPEAAYSTASTVFSKTANSLLEQLNSAAGIEIIRRLGQRRSTRYAVNPRLLLTDLRTDEDRATEILDFPSRRGRARGSQATEGTGSGEFRELTEEGDLYERIIDIERIPHMDIKDGAAIELSIDDNTILRIGGHQIRLGRHERYLFNALMLLRGMPTSGKELRQFGFFPGARANTASMTFSKAMTNLINQINEALGVEVFKKVGERRNMHYAVNPNLTLIDLRTDEDKAKAVVDEQKRRGRARKNPGKYPELEEGYMPNGKKSSYKGPVYEGYGADAEHYDDSERRTLLITELVQRYKDHPQVQVALHRLNNGAPIYIGPEQSYYRYLAEINQYDLLDPSDEIRLFKILETGVNLYRDWGVHDGNEQALIDAVIARQIVYLSNLRLVVDHAKTWAAYSKTMSRLDYVQEGNIGLADAIDRFDYTKGFKFSTYATWWVRQRIQRSQADKDRLIRIPVHMHDRLVNFSKTVRELTDELDRDPNPWEIAYKLDEPVADVLKLQAYYRMEPASLNALLEDAEKPSTVGPSGRQAIDQIADPKDEIEQAQQEAEDTAVVEALFSKRNLTLPEKYVLSFRLGFVIESFRGTVLEYTDGTVVRYDDLVAVMTDPEVSKNTLEEASQLFGVTRERIRQIEKKGLDKIRLNYHRE